MAKNRSRKRPRRKTSGGRVGAESTTVRALRREIARLTKERDAVRERHARQLASLRQAGDRRVAALMREIAGLRHHEARADALTRLVSERDAALREQAERLRRLEALASEVSLPPSA